MDDNDEDADVIRDALALYRAALSDSGVSDEEYQLLLDNITDSVRTRALLLSWAFEMVATALPGAGQAAGFLARTAECFSPVDVRESIREWQYDFEKRVAGGSA